MIDAQRIPARSPDGEGHHVVYEGPAHLIPMVETLEGLPVLPGRASTGCCNIERSTRHDD